MSTSPPCQKVAIPLMDVSDVSTAALSLAEFTALAQRYTKPLHAFLYGLVHDHDLARDLTQDTFCEAWRAAQSQTPPLIAGESEVSMRRWLYRVAYRRAIDALRHRRVIRWESLDETHADEISVASSFEEQIAEGEALQRALAELAPQDVACLLLIVVQRFTANEAAQILGASPQAIGKRISRAKRRLLTVYLAQNELSPSQEESR